MRLGAATHSERSAAAGPRTTCAPNTGVKQFHHPVVGELSLSFNRWTSPQTRKADSTTAFSPARVTRKSV
jgi:hypothetical protein